MFVYMIRNTSNKLYVGISKNPKQRLEKHNYKQGARFTKSKPNFKIVFLEEYETELNARRREIQIKKWSRKKKEVLIKKYSLGLNTKF